MSLASEKDKGRREGGALWIFIRFTATADDFANADRSGGPRKRCQHISAFEDAWCTLAMILPRSQMLG